MYIQCEINARTLPHPRHNNNATNVMDHRARDDQMLLNKAVYIPSPSPAPPPDGSYYNMNSDRYLSYPPLTDGLSTPLKVEEERRRFLI
uniref:Uncharacterized protein n=1 Tax=Glossina palpalis gambiensis TaxID=67801 RepID=A0A1B0BLM1_9MUSC